MPDWYFVSSQNFLSSRDLGESKCNGTSQIRQFFLQTDQFHVHKTPSDTKTSETLRYHDLIFELGMSGNILCEEKWIFFS